MSGVINGSYRLFSCVFEPAGGVDNKMYVDGVQQSVSTSKTGSPTYIGTDPLCIGSANATQYFNDNILLAYYWPYRGLTAAEMAWLAEEPYAFVKQIVSRTYFIGGTALAITGTSALNAAAATLSSSGTITNAYTGTSALSAAPATIAATGNIVNAYTGSSALSAAAAILAATGTISGAAANNNNVNFMLLGVG